MRINSKDDALKAIGEDAKHMLIVFKRKAVPDLAYVLESLQNAGARIPTDRLPTLKRASATGKWDSWTDQVLVLEKNFPLEDLDERVWQAVDTIELLSSVPTPVQRLLMGADFITGEIQFSNDPDLPNVFAILEERAASPDYLFDRGRIIFERMKNGPLSDHK